MPGRVDKELVKQQLRLEQEAWEAEQLAAGCSEPQTLQFWSVGKLLRVLQASRSTENALESLTKCGIQRHLVGSADPRRATSQPTAEHSQAAPTADAVTYTSGSVWLTGFLHFGEDVESCDTLHLCDNNAKLPSFLLAPSPQLVDQLVLVKRWVLVDKAFGGVRTAGSMFLEVHDEKPVPLMPIAGAFVDWTRERVTEVLQRRFQTKDPPMYTGTESWAAVAARSSGGGDENGNLGSTAAQERAEGEQLRKGKKRKRVHCVFGRVTSVSPISRQKDRDSSHFFVEIEHPRSCNGSKIQIVVTVMFTGVHNMRWHLFLCPGRIVLLTDLVKVLSRECEMFLLQATVGHRSKDPVEASKGSLKTTVLVWQEPAPPQSHLAQWIDDSFRGYSKNLASLCCGKLLDYEGKVSRLLWDECIELIGSDGAQVIVCLFHFPYTHELIRIRKDATIRVCGAHVLRWPTPVGGKLVIGLCPRSHFIVTAFSDPSSSCIVMGTRSRRSRAHKKWSSLGDFHRQSMVLSMWLLEVLELLDTKFVFGEDEQVLLFGSSSLSFPRIRRRRAVAHVAKKLNVEMGGGHDQTATTLGALFLKCHSKNAGSCLSIQLPPEKLLACSRVVTIRELKDFGERKAKEMLKAKSSDDSPLSIQISAENLDWCILLGCIRGNVDSGDLEIYDRTGSISLQLRGDAVSTDFDGERGVYVLRSFDLTVEDYNRSDDPSPEEKLPLVCCVGCVAVNLEYIPMLGDDGISYSPEDKTQTEAGELLILVTHVDALPRSDIRRAGLLPEYRVVHGIVCPVGQELQSDVFMKSAFVADILINTRCIHWHLQKGGYYRIKAIGDTPNTETRSTSHFSGEDQAIRASIDYLEAKQIAGGNNVVCFDSIRHYSGAGRGDSNEERPFRVYRVEQGHDSVGPVFLGCDNFAQARCEEHDECQKSEQNRSGILDPPKVDSLLAKVSAHFAKGQQYVKQTTVNVSVLELGALSVLGCFLQQLEAVSQVHNLLHHPLSIPPQTCQESIKGDGEQPAVMTVNPNLHKAHLISLAGMITKKNYYWQSTPSHQPSTAIIGVKRARDVDNESSAGYTSNRRLLCILQVRDLQHLDTVEIRVDASRFGLLGTLRLNSVVEFSRLQGFIARSSYKVYLKWSHLTAARPVSQQTCLPIPSDAELYGAMPTSFLNDLYHSSSVDRRLHRYAVGVMHLSYVLMKRKCESCHQALQLVRRRGCWKHADPQPGGSYYRECKWKHQHWAISDPVFKTRSYLGITARCVIDDGSAQAELFLENAVAWELLTCPDRQHQRFEDILSHYVDELSYFSGRTANGSFATSRAEREQEYYQNELRAFVVDALPSLRSVVVFAQRFYKAKQQQGGTSVLTFGKDIHLTTKTSPQPKLEAKRVDRLHVRSELQRRLAQLRALSAD